MRLNNPSFIILIGSGIVAVFSLTILILFKNLFFLDFSWIQLIIIALSIGLFTFWVLQFILLKLIKNRIDLLVKKVYLKTKKQELNTENKSIDNLIQDIESDIENWENDNVKEIDKLKEQELFRREFLGNLSHELKTPVFSIQGYLLTLLEGGVDDPSVNKVFLERAAKATDRMANIIADLDQITKIEADNIKLDIRPFDILELIKELFESLEIKAIEKEISLRFEKDYNSIVVDADRNKIAQVLSNLIGNSIFYGNPKGTTTISIDVIDKLVLVSVQDDGPGIEEKHHSRLFERFYRVEKSRNRNEGGSGLGLAIVKHLLEAHGQSITMKSKVGIGSSFSFSLPKSKSNNPGLYSSRGVQLR